MINSCIQFLEKTVLDYPNKISIVDGNFSITFNQLKEKALTIASNISSKYYNQPIAVFLPKSINAIECFMGVLYTANFYIPIDIKSPNERLVKVIENLNPIIILTNTTHEQKLTNLLNNKPIQIINIDTINYQHFNYQPSIEKVIDTYPIYCIYTSGSTGTPKGVLIPHRGVIDYIDWASECYSININDRIGNQAPFYFDNSVLDIYLMLKTGATLYIIPEINFAFPVKLVQYLEKTNINFIFWVPSVMNMVCNTNALNNHNLSLTKILFAGEVMPVKVLNYWKKHIPDALYSNLYGPTEITVDCTYYNVNREFNETESLPIGISCKNTNILILNDQNDSCKLNETGELCVRGSSLALGYWNDIEKTNKAFVQNPLQNNFPEKIYRTGDLVKLNEQNEILYLGRKDSQIKHLGYRIELGEIETALTSITDIKNACVLYNNSKQEITLFYETNNLEITDIYIKKYLNNILPKYMIPVTNIKLNKLPLNHNGKIDRFTLANKYFKID